MYLDGNHSDMKSSSETATSYSATGFVIGVPLLVFVVFAFSFLLVSGASEQRTRAASLESNHTVTTGIDDSLMLVTQPTRPQLTTAPAADDTAAAPGAIGPSSTEADGALQSATKNNDNNANAKLQATRKTTKLEDLH